MKIVLLGAPGSGKGTQAENLSKILGIPSISTGKIIRDEIKSESPLGVAAKTAAESGQLVPDDVVSGMVKKRLCCPDCLSGFILDGYPRTIVQAETLEKIGIIIDKVLSIEVSDEEIVERLSGRIECSKCGRSYHAVHRPPKVSGVCDVCGGKLVRREDDSPETIRKRIGVYHDQTEPLKQFYGAQSKLCEVRSQEKIEDTVKLSLAALGI